MHAKKLIDKARIMCVPSNYSVLASRLGVTRQALHSWKVGDQPIPEQRVREIARIAHEDADDWIVLINSEQDTPAMQEMWKRIASRLGIAASVLCAVGIAGNAYFQGVSEPVTSAVCLLCSAILAAAITHAAGKVARYAPTSHHTAYAY